MALPVVVVDVLTLWVKGPILRLCFLLCYPEKARTRSNITHLVPSRHGVKYIEMYLNTNTLEGCKYNNNNKYSICLRHISSNKTIQRRITLYMNIQIT